MTPVAIIAAREEARDWSLPPGVPAPRLTEGWLLATESDQTARTVPLVMDAVGFWKRQVAAGRRVFVLGLDLWLAAFLWQAPDNPVVQEVLAGLAPALTRQREAPTLCSFEDILPTMEVLTGETGLADLLDRETDAGELLAMARKASDWLDRSLSMLPVLNTAREISSWIGSGRLPGRPVWNAPAGPLGQGASVAGRAVGLCMSWTGMRVDREYLAGQEGRSMRLDGLAATIRLDDRVHPLHVQQRYMRLEAQAPRYQSLSGRTDPNERAAVLADEGQTLLSLDVGQAELFTAAVNWKELFGDGRLLDQIAGKHATDIHQRTGERLRAAGLLVQSDPWVLRAAGKQINFAMGNLASPERVAQSVADIDGREATADDTKVAGQVMKDLIGEYPWRQWETICRDIAFRSRPDRRALVPVLSGRFLLIEPAQYRRGAVGRKPSPQAVASAMTQTLFADMHALGTLALIVKASPGTRVIGSVFDELLVTAPPEAELPVQEYTEVAGRVARRGGLRAAVHVYGEHWGI